MREFLFEITESVEELNKYQKDSVYTKYGRTDDLIDEVIENHRISDQVIFRDAIKQYLQDPGQELIKFTEDLYTTAVNRDLLAKEDEYVRFPQIPQSNRKIILDTNALVPLLADTDDLHHLTATVCNKSLKEDFELFYTPGTAEELDDLIDYSNSMQTGVYAGNSRRGNSSNQFVKDYGRKRDISWSEYHSNLRGWRETLEEDFDIREIDWDTVPNEKVKEKTVNKLIESTGEISNQQFFNKVKHDGDLLGLVATERVRSDWDFGPFVLTFHEPLAELGKEFSEDSEIKNISGGRPLALHPRSWLNYLISFSSVEFKSGDQEQISLALLSAASDFNETMDISDYVHHFAPKVDVELEQESNLEKLLVNHRLSDQLEDAVDNGENLRAEKISREILTDQEYLETIKEEREYEESIQMASSTIEDLESRIEELENQTESQSSSHKTDPESSFRTSYREKYTQFRSSFPQRLSKTDFPKPPDHQSDMENIKEWLQITTATITTSEDLPDQVEELQPQLEELLAEAISLSS
jgi:hypothetical protein